jgi:hypothetical protein
MNSLVVPLFFTLLTNLKLKIYTLFSTLDLSVTLNILFSKSLVILV